MMHTANTTSIPQGCCCGTFDNTRTLRCYQCTWCILYIIAMHCEDSATHTGFEPVGCPKFDTHDAHSRHSHNPLTAAITLPCYQGALGASFKPVYSTLTLPRILTPWHTILTPPKAIQLKMPLTFIVCLKSNKISELFGYIPIDSFIYIPMD